MTGRLSLRSLYSREVDAAEACPKPDRCRMSGYPPSIPDVQEQSGLRAGVSSGQRRSPREKGPRKGGRERDHTLVRQGHIQMQRTGVKGVPAWLEGGGQKTGLCRWRAGQGPSAVFLPRFPPAHDGMRLGCLLVHVPAP